uniref:Uncharacterized protein n=1 Tax=Cucumis melo TaxID=3656 RepID=A0A9I9DXA4_CUCME
MNCGDFESRRGIHVLTASFTHRPTYRSHIIFILQNFSRCSFLHMGHQVLQSFSKRRVEFRLCNVSGFTNELLEIHSDDPSLHVLFIPGNPESKLVDIHVAHMDILVCYDWEGGRLFSLQEQIDHKVEFVRQELQNKDIPLILDRISPLNCSAGSRIGYCPKLFVPLMSLQLSGDGSLTILLDPIGGVLHWIASIYDGEQRITSAIFYRETCKYHSMRNVLYMAMTEFEKFSETPDWAFMKKVSQKLSFLFCMDDHWAPMHVYEEIFKQVPEIDLSVEREGYSHAFCCSEAASIYIAQYVASLVKKHLSD